MRGGCGKGGAATAGAVRRGGGGGALRPLRARARGRCGELYAGGGGFWWVEGCARGVAGAWRVDDWPGGRVQGLRVCVCAKAGSSARASPAAVGRDGRQGARHGGPGTTLFGGRGCASVTVRSASDLPELSLLLLLFLVSSARFRFSGLSRSCPAPPLPPSPPWRWAGRGGRRPRLRRCTAASSASARAAGRSCATTAAARWTRARRSS